MTERASSLVFAETSIEKSVASWAATSAAILALG
jgi:hypothetical protein